MLLTFHHIAKYCMEDFSYFDMKVKRFWQTLTTFKYTCRLKKNLLMTWHCPPVDFKKGQRHKNFDPIMNKYKQFRELFLFPEDTRLQVMVLYWNFLTIFTYKFCSSKRITDHVCVKFRKIVFACSNWWKMSWHCPFSTWNFSASVPLWVLHNAHVCVE